MADVLKIGGRLASAGLVLGVALGVLSGCGVKSAPEYPAGATYPRDYPVPLPAVEAQPNADERKPGGATGGNTPDGFYQYPNQPPK